LNVEIGELKSKSTKKEVDEMSPKLKCKECGETQDAPSHCGQPMHVEEVDGKSMLVCWMSASCGKQDIPIHHDKPMELVE